MFPKNLSVDLCGVRGYSTYDAATAFENGDLYRTCGCNPQWALTFDQNNMVMGDRKPLAQQLAIPADICNSHFIDELLHIITYVFLFST